MLFEIQFLHHIQLQTCYKGITELQKKPKKPPCKHIKISTNTPRDTFEED